MEFNFTEVGAFQGVTGGPNVLNNPTSLQFGPDGRLYVSEQNGDINAFTIAIDEGEYIITDHELLTLPGGGGIVKSIQNHNDDGSEANQGNRQVTGLVTAGTEDNPVLYITSSDPRISANGEVNLDTNSGVLSRATWTGSEWEVVDLIRGLPRSEENHSNNGMVLDGDKLYLMVGGNTNNGAPSSFFSFTAEYTLSGALLEIDLTDLEGREILTDPNGGQNGAARDYIYDLPTLDDPNIENVTDGVGEDANGLDENGPWGGNDGLNQAILPADAPLRIFSDGLRNPYDVVLTESGNLYTIDNGSNGNLGGNPNTDGNGEAINTPNNGGSGDPEPLFLLQDGSYHGHPNPIRANQDQSHTVYDDDGNPDESVDVNSVPDISELVPDSVDIQEGFLIDPSKFTGDPDRLLESGVRVERDSPQSNALLTLNSSTNGIVEYTDTSAFDGLLAGQLLTVGFNGNLTRIELNEDGTEVVSSEAIISGLGGPLDVTTGPDGTIWVAEIGANTIKAFTPSDQPLPEDPDFDNDGIDNIVDPFIRDATNGGSVVVVGGETLLWDFDSDQDGNLPGPNGYGTGLTGHMINGTVDFEQFLTQELPEGGNRLDNIKFNTAAGGGATVIEQVSNGDPFIDNNSGEFLLHTGVTIDPTVESFTVKWSAFNPAAPSDLFPNGQITGGFQQIGGYIGSGDQSNFIKVVAIQTNTVSKIEVVLEDDDEVTAFDIAAADIFDPNVIAQDSKIFFELEVDVFGQVASATVSYETDQGLQTVTSGSQLDLSGSTVMDVIEGNFQTEGQTTGLAVGLFSSNTQEPVANTFQAVFDDIEITAVEGNVAPVAGDDTVATGVNSVLIIPVASLLSNDSDPNDTDTVTVASVSNASNGTAILDDNGTANDPLDDFIEFTPGLNFEGTASFNYTIIDGNGLDDSALVSVNVADRVVLYRVNAAGSEIDPGDGGPVWAADPGNTTGGGTDGSENPNRVSSGQNISGTSGISFGPTVPEGTPVGLFAQERWDPASGQTMLWEFPVGAGLYEVRLYMANNFGGTSGEGQRVFDVAIDGEIPANLDDIDLIPLFGHKTGGVVTNTVAVTDGTLEIEFFHVVENPLVNAIEIIQIGNAEDIEPAVSIISGNQTVDEDAGQVQISLATDVTVPADETVEVTVEIVPGTSTPGADYNYVPVNGSVDTDTGVITETLSIAGSSSDVTFLIDILDDMDLEASEAFSVNIVSVSDNALISGLNSALITILDNDAPVNPGTVVVAINAGGPALTQNSIDFSADQFFDNGTAFTDNNAGNGPQPIFDGTVFETERFGGIDNGTMSYTIPVDPGTYEIELYFAEIFLPNGAGDGIGARVFDVAIEGITVLDDFDLLAETGGDFNQPVVITVPQDFSPDQDSDTDALNLTFSASSDNAKINAIVVRTAEGEYSPPPDTLFGTPVEISDDRLAPEDGGELSLGSNIVVATQEGELGENEVRDRDYFTFSIPEGAVLTGIILEDFQNDNGLLPDGFIGIQLGNQLTVDETTGQPDEGAEGLLGGLIYGQQNIGQDLLEIMAQGGEIQPGAGALDPFQPSLTGEVTVWLNQGAGPGTPTLNFIVEEAPVAGDGAYLPNAQGNFIWEAESADNDGPGGFVVKDESELEEGHAAPSGGQYIETSNNFFGGAGNGETLVWQFTPQEDGFIRINLISSFQGDDPTEENDAWTKIQLDGVDIPALDRSVPLVSNNGFYKTYQSGPASTDWKLANKNVDFDAQPIVVPVIGGETYDFLLSERSAGFEIDKIALEFFTEDPGLSSFGGFNDLNNQEISPQDDAEPEPLVGEATLEVTVGSDNVQISNFGDNSFVLTNTGTKEIAKIEVDVTNALYPDSVFDPFGVAGDTVTKPLTINTNTGTGAIDPTNASYVGAGGIAGFEGIVIEFDPATDGGFDPGESLGFSVDMDPNSIAGAEKDTLDAGADPVWDIGGVSGAELIGSSFTITFTDGTTATGQLGGAGNNGGSKGLASQAIETPQTATLTVNGLGEGGVGTYDSTGPLITIEGEAGQTARVVLTKGIIQPVNNAFFNGTAAEQAYAPQLQAQLDALAASDFPANNAAFFQTVDIVLDGTVQDITSLFNLTDVPDFELVVPEDELPLGLVAAVIDPANNDLPIGPVSAPIYLTFSEEPSADLALTKTVDDDTPAFGDEITFTLTVTNEFGDEATGITVEDVLANGYAFTGATGDGVYDEVTGIWTIDPLLEGESASIDITAIVLDSAATPDTVLYRVNPGGTTVAAADGSSLDWLGDTGPSPLNQNPPGSFEFGPGVTLTGGNTFSTGQAIDVSGLGPDTSAPEAVFQTERFGPNAANGAPQAWDFDVENGDYIVNLYFAELFFPGSGGRVFDVEIEDALVLDDFDIAAVAGGNFTATLQSFETTVSDGVLDIDLISSVNNGKISAIEIIQKGFDGPASYDNSAQILTSDLIDPDSTAGNGILGEDDDASVVVAATAQGQNVVTIAVETEAAEPDQNGQFIVSLEEVAETDTVITFTIEGSATADVDYTALDGVVTIPAGDLSAPIEVAVLDDLDLESAEDIIVTLTDITSGDADVVLDEAPTATMTLNDDEFTGTASVEITGVTTFGSSSFQLTNTSDAGIKIKSITFDIVTSTLSAGLDASGEPGSEFLGAVFDPTGEAGDEGSQGLKFADNSAGLLDENGAVLPASTAGIGYVGTAELYPFTGQLPGSNEGAPGGYRFMTLNFESFANEEGQEVPSNFVFGVDIDPQSIQGAVGSGQAGAVSGAEISGTLITIEFEAPNGSTLVETRPLVATGLNSAEAVFDGNGPIEAPTMEVTGLVEGIADRRALTDDAAPEVVVGGLTEGDLVQLWVFDASGYEKNGGDGTETEASDPFHANQFDAAPTILSGVADANGEAVFQVDISG
ncbi:MAG: malectin domain-containing carbohydrate-binding protein [Pseudomonadota bacterium]